MRWCSRRQGGAVPGKTVCYPDRAFLTARARATAAIVCGETDGINALTPLLAETTKSSSSLRMMVPTGFARLSLGGAFIAYFVGTALLYFWGPWHYPMAHGAGRLVAFLIAVHVAFVAGYLFGVRGEPGRARTWVSVPTLVLVSVIAELVLLFPTSRFNTGHWVPLPWAALGDLGAAYTTSIALRESATPYIHYLRILIAPLLALGVPLGVYYWGALPTVTRALFTASVVGTIALYVTMGANAGAGHWMALFPWFVLAAHFAGVQPLDRRGWLKAGAIQVLSAVLFAVLFSATMVQRTGSFAKYGYIPGIDTGLEGERRAAPAARSTAKIGADGLAGYLTQGYFAVYLSLDAPFIPCFGVGNSVFVQRQAARITGNTDLLDCAYPMRIESEGWRSSTYWATIYPWIASDVTFPGTVFVLFLIGWMSGRVWLDVLGGGNPIAVALLGQILVLLYYVPAHNKVMHSGESAVAFCVLVAAWLLTRRRQPAAG